MSSSRPSDRRHVGRGALVVVVAAVVLIAASCDFNGTWGPVVTTPPPTGATASDDLSVVACVPSGACVAAGRVAAVRNGGVWTALPAPPRSISSLACSAVDDCLGGSNGFPIASPFIYHFDGTTWSPTDWPSNVEPKSIACPSATTCMAIGQSQAGAVVRSWNGSNFSATTLPTGTYGASGVSCSSTTFCLAVGSTGAVPWAAKWTGGAAWTSVATSGLADGLDRVTCLSATLCYASTYPSTDFQLATWNGTTLVGGAIQPLQDFVSGWWNFACGAGTPNRCFGASRHSEFGSTSLEGLVTASAGFFLEFGASLRDVACATATNCVAIGTDTGGSHAAWHFDGAGWTADTFNLPIEADPQIDRVSCPTSTFCMAIGTYAHGTRRRPYVIVWNGTTWAPPAHPVPFDTSDLVGTLETGITCLSPTFCAATIRTEDDRPEFPQISGEMSTWNGSTWTRQAGEAPTQLVCFSTTSCVGLDYRASYRWSGTAISNQPNLLGADVRRLSCASPTRCVGVIADPSNIVIPTDLLSWDGTTTSVVRAPAPDGQVASIRDVTCLGTAPTRCVAVGAAGPSGTPINTGGRPYVLVGDGTGSWTPAALPVTGPGGLNTVSCPDAAECLATGTRSVSGTPDPRLVLAMVIDTWKVAPDLPAGAGGAARFETISCVPGLCNVLFQRGAPRAREAVATTYRWSYDS